MIWQEDEELIDWLLNLEPMNAGSFLRAIGEAAMRADSQNYPVMRPLLLELKKKYPDYAKPNFGRSMEAE